MEFKLFRVIEVPTHNSIGDSQDVVHIGVDTADYAHYPTS
jgi:hypothetical protein